MAHLVFLLNASWVEFLKTLDDDRAFQALVWGITGTRPQEPDARLAGVCPYRGLEAFRPEDAPCFFGREALTGWLVSSLRREVRAAQGVRFLGVLGPSGSGKSSVVLAGLLPQLKAGAIEGSEHWPVAVLRPGDNPLKNLAAGVVPLFLPADALADVGQALNLINAMRDDPEGQGLDLFARMNLSGRPEGTHLVVVVDQFEEVFTYRPQDDQARTRFERDRTRFFGNLLNAAAVPGGRVAVVLTMRSDFLGACAVFPQLAAVLSAHQELVGPMTAAELRAAIERPAFRAGGEVEPALTERLLADVEGQAGALPLLQFALTEVWKKRDVRRLTLRAYASLGEDAKGVQRGIEGVLEHRADEIYRNLKPEEQELCRRVFLRLVQPGEGVEDTKRRVTYRELLPEDPARAEQITKLVRTLADRDARLITTEGDTIANGAVEVAHEALIRGWTQLRNWVNAERAGLRTQRRLTEAAQEWAAANPEHKEAYQYSGARLVVCLEWTQAHRDELSVTEAAFLAVSEETERQRKQDALDNERRLREIAQKAEAAERKRAEEAEGRTREAEKHKQDAEVAAAEQRHLASKFFRATLVAIVFAFGSLGLAVLASWVSSVAETAKNEAYKASEKAQKNEKEAKAQANLANARRLAAISELLRETHQDLALLLAVEATQVSGAEDTIEARNSLGSALLTRPELNSFLHIDEGQITSVASSSDGKILAVGYRAGKAGGSNNRGGVVLWDVGKGARLAAQLPELPKEVVTSVALSGDGKTLAAGHVGSGRGGVVLWDVGKGIRLAAQPPVGPKCSFTVVALSGDGKTLAAGFGNPFHSDPLFRDVRLWEVEKGAPLATRPLGAPEGGVITSVAFSGDGKTLAVGFETSMGDCGVVLWRVGKGGPLPPPLVIHGVFVTSVALSVDGKTLAVGYGTRDALPDKASGGAMLFDVEKGKWLAAQPPGLTEGMVSSVALSGDGKTLAVGFGGFYYETQDVVYIGRTTDGRADGRGGVVLWDVEKGAPLASQPPGLPKGSYVGVALSADGKTLAAGHVAYVYGGARSRVVMWDAGRDTLASRPVGLRRDSIRSVALSGDGKTLAVGYRDGKADRSNNRGGVVLWDVEKDARLTSQPLGADKDNITVAALSGDGKTLAVVNHLGEVVLWEAGKGDWAVRQLPGLPRGNVENLALSNDGKTLAVVSRTTNRNVFSPLKVLLWDVEKDARLAVQPPVLPEEFVTSVALSGDGKTLAAGYRIRNPRRNGLILWEVGKGGWAGSRLPWLVLGEVREIGGVALSGDGKTLAVGYITYETRTNILLGGVELFEVGFDSRIRRARQIANRNLTHAEWRQYFPGEKKYRKTFEDLPEPPQD